jgi:L-cysteine S-thiosulfotransferase
VRATVFSLSSLLLVLASGAAATAQTAPYTVSGDAILAPLEGLIGDAARGRVLVVNRQKGLCLICHSGPFPEERFQGTLSPSLAGAGARSTDGQLRLRMVDSRKVNPSTLMPAYHSTEGLERVGTAWRDRPILTAQEIEDIVAFLKTLRE